MEGCWRDCDLVDWSSGFSARTFGVTCEEASELTARLPFTDIGLSGRSEVLGREASELCRFEDGALVGVAGGGYDCGEGLCRRSSEGGCVSTGSGV